MNPKCKRRAPNSRRTVNEYQRWSMNWRAGCRRCGNEVAPQRVELHRRRGKMLVRGRIEALLDRESPFLERSRVDHLGHVLIFSGEITKGHYWQISTFESVNPLPAGRSMMLLRARPFELWRA